MGSEEGWWDGVEGGRLHEEGWVGLRIHTDVTKRCLVCTWDWVCIWQWEGHHLLNSRAEPAGDTTSVTSFSSTLMTVRAYKGESICYPEPLEPDRAEWEKEGPPRKPAHQAEVKLWSAQRGPRFTIMYSIMRK